LQLTSSEIVMLVIEVALYKTCFSEHIKLWHIEVPSNKLQFKFIKTAVLLSYVMLNLKVCNCDRVLSFI